MTGEELYREWLGDPEGKTDAARYFPSMNPAMQEQWDRLAATVSVQRETLQGVRDGLQKSLGDTPSVAKAIATIDRALAL